MLRLKKTDWIIIKCVAIHGDAGAGTTEIAKRTKLNRSTVYRICSKLLLRHIIQKKNKRAKYHLTRKLYGDSNLLPFSLGMDAVSDMQKWKYISVTNRFCNNEIAKKIMEYWKWRNKTKLTAEDEEQLDELSLFEFANRIGALVLYFLINAMNPKILGLKIKGFDTFDTFAEFRDKDEMAISWIENSVKPARILQEFAKISIVTKGLEPFESLETSVYTLDEANYTKLVTAYSNVYRDIFDRLERIRKEIPQITERYRG